MNLDWLAPLNCSLRSAMILGRAPCRPRSDKRVAVYARLPKNDADDFLQDRHRYPGRAYCLGSVAHQRNNSGNAKQPLRRGIHERWASFGKEPWSVTLKWESVPSYLLFGRLGFGLLRIWCKEILENVSQSVLHRHFLEFRARY